MWCCGVKTWKEYDPLATVSVSGFVGEKKELAALARDGAVHSQLPRGGSITLSADATVEQVAGALEKLLKKSEAAYKPR